MPQNNELIGELLLAADCGDTAAVTQILESGIEADARAEGGASPLLMAVRNGHVETIRALLQHGAQPNPDGWRGYTSLTHAIHRSLRKQSSEPLELLIAAGAQYNLIDAALSNNIELTTALLDEGGDVNFGEGTYNGPLLQEVSVYGHVEMVDLLLRRGANIEATDDLCQTALMIAARYGQIEIIECLLDNGAEINAGYRSPVNALSYAINEGHAELADLLLSRGAQWWLADALAQGNVALFLSLLDEEIADLAADADPSDESETTAIVDRISGKSERIAMEAASLGNVEIVTILLDRGASHLVGWRDQHSLIAEASKHGHLKVVHVLVNRGADFYAIGRDGLTPLAWALKEKQSEVSEFLRFSGANW